MRKIVRELPYRRTRARDVTTRKIHTGAIIMKETYLGDGLYASFDGFMFTLRAPREGGDHWVGLEPQVMEAFDEFRRRMLKPESFTTNHGETK